jgi:hypothetical protein
MKAVIIGASSSRVKPIKKFDLENKWFFAN